MKKLLFILALFISFVAAAQPGPVNSYKTRVRYWQVMADSLLGTPSDTFNLRTPRAISYGWNMFPWITRKNDVTYGWSIARQRWEAQIGSASNISIINDSTIQVCNGQGVCDTFNVNINAPTITSVTVINDSTVIICNVNSCDTAIYQVPAPPITTVNVLNDSTIIVCNANGCDTVIFHITTPPIITTTVINDSTIVICDANSCDTVTFNIITGPISTTTILNDSTIIVCDANGCDTLVINTVTPPITSTTIINDSTIEVCNAGGCDTLIFNTTNINTTVINDSTIQICNNNSCDTIIVGSQITTTVLNDSTIEICNNLGCDTIVFHSQITTTTILNDSTIIICSNNGTCDTIVFNQQITNISIINDTTIQVCGSDVEGAEEITNGGFTGNASTWQLGALWTYNNNDIIHNFGSVQATAQAGALVEGGNYRVTVDIGGTTGTVDVKLDAGTMQTYNAGVGPVAFTGTWSNANNYKIVLLPSNDFDGTIDNVSVRRILPNCDTIPISPTFFLDTFHIFVESPLHARNDSTIYITRASKLDSGFLSDSDFTYFWHKVDTLYYHPSTLGVDTFLYDNGDSTGIAWYYNDVNPNGLISGGQVLSTGTPYVFTVTPAVYRINGVRYTSPATQITVPTADPSLPRTDVFYVDTSGNAALLVGVAASPNLKPSIDIGWQLELTSVDLAASSPPSIIDSMIYNENVAPEWIPITSPGTTSDPNNLLSPWLGFKSINVTNISAGDYINFPHTGPFDMAPFLSANGSLVGFILLKAAMPSTATLRAAFYNGGTQVTPLTVIPIVKNNTTTYQGFSVPLSSFAFTGNIVTTLRIQYVNTVTGDYAGFYLDAVDLQSGIQPPTPNSNALILVSRRGGTDSVMGTYQDGSIRYQFKDSTGSPGTVITADNGLSKNTPSNVQLGGPVGTPSPLLNNRYIENGVFSLNLTTTTGNVGNNFAPIIATFNGTNNATSGNIVSAGRFINQSGILNSGAINAAVWGVVNNAATPQFAGLFQNFGSANEGDGYYPSGDAGVFGYGGNGVWGNGSAVGVKATNAGGESGSGLPLYAILTGPIPNGTHEVASFGFQSPAFVGSFALDGLGVNISFRIPTSTQSGGVVATPMANMIQSIWSNATDASRTSEFSIIGINSATQQTLMTLGGNGQLTLNRYITGNFEGGTSSDSVLVVTSAGIVKKRSAAAVGVSGLQTLQQTFDTEVGGSVLSKADTILAGANYILITGTDLPFWAKSSNTILSGIQGQNTSSGIGVTGVSSSGIGVSGVSSSGTAISAQSTTGLGLDLSIAPASTNSVVTTARLTRQTSGTAANGIGGSIDLFNETDNGTSFLSNQIISTLTTAATATRTSQLEITGVDAATTRTLVTMAGNGAIAMPGAGTPATTLSVTNTTGVGISSTTTTGNGISVSTTSGTGVDITSSSGFGIRATSLAGIPGVMFADPTSTNTSVEVLQIKRSSQGTGATGIGGYISYFLENDNNSSIEASRIGTSYTSAANGSEVSQILVSAKNSGALGNVISFEGNKRTMLYGRLEMQQGADVASVAGAIAVGLDGNVFELTGTNAVTLISNLNFVNGSMITFLFTSTATLTDGTANSGTDIGMELAGNANFVGSADDVITLVLSEIGGTQRWREVSRSVN